MPRGVEPKLKCPDPELGLPQGVAYYGPEGLQIQVYKGGERNFPFNQARRRPIEVLGGRGTIGLIHEGFSAEFRYEGERYKLYTYGNTLNELRRFAEGLRPR